MDIFNYNKKRLTFDEVLFAEDLYDFEDDRVNMDYLLETKAPVNVVPYVAESTMFDQLIDAISDIKQVSAVDRSSTNFYEVNVLPSSGKSSMTLVTGLDLNHDPSVTQLLNVGSIVDICPSNFGKIPVTILEVNICNYCALNAHSVHQHIVVVCPGKDNYGIFEGTCRLYPPYYPPDFDKIKTAISVISEEVKLGDFNKFDNNYVSPALSIIDPIFKMTPTVEIMDGFPGAGKTTHLVTHISSVLNAPLIQKTYSEFSSDVFVDAPTNYPFIVLAPTNQLCVNFADKLASIGLKPFLYGDNFERSKYGMSHYLQSDPFYVKYCNVRDSNRVDFSDRNYNLSYIGIDDKKVTASRNAIYQISKRRNKITNFSDLKILRKVSIKAAMSKSNVIIMTPSHVFNFFKCNLFVDFEYMLIDEISTILGIVVFLISLLRVQHIIGGGDRAQLKAYNKLESSRVPKNSKIAKYFYNSLSQLLCDVKTTKYVLKTYSHRIPSYFNSAFLKLFNYDTILSFDDHRFSYYNFCSFKSHVIPRFDDEGSEISSYIFDFVKDNMETFKAQLDNDQLEYLDKFHGREIETYYVDSVDVGKNTFCSQIALDYYILIFFYSNQKPGCSCVLTTPYLAYVEYYKRLFRDVRKLLKFSMSFDVVSSRVYHGSENDIHLFDATLHKTTYFITDDIFLSAFTRTKYDKKNNDNNFDYFIENYSFCAVNLDPLSHLSAFSCGIMNDLRYHNMKLLGENLIESFTNNYYENTMPGSDLAIAISSIKNSSVIEFNGLDDLRRECGINLKYLVPSYDFKKRLHLFDLLLNKYKYPCKKYYMANFRFPYCKGELINYIIRESNENGMDKFDDWFFELLNLSLDQPFANYFKYFSVKSFVCYFPYPNLNDPLFLDYNFSFDSLQTWNYDFVFY